MKLYHGTSDKHLPQILKKGLCPRSGKKGNWEEFPSRSDMVYLTLAYAPYFALNQDGNPTVLEIDADLLNEEHFLPDEDFISQTISKQEKLPFKTIHNKVRRQLKSYQTYWPLSLEKIGNCCYQGKIPASAIKRYVVWDVEKQLCVSLMSLDPTITSMNYKILGEKYRGLITWLFGDCPNLPSDDPIYSAFDNNEEIMQNPYFAERVKYLEEQYKNRDEKVVTGISCSMTQMLMNSTFQRN